MKYLCVLPLFALLGLSAACRHTETSKGASTPGATTPANPSVPPPSAVPSKTEVAAAGIGDIFRYNYGPRNPGFPKPAVRAAFRRTVGCARATFKVAEGLDGDYAQGIFAKTEGASSEREAWVRIGMDRTDPTGVDDFDKASIAISMKLLPGAAGDVPPIVPVEGEHDFILQNHHIFFVDSAQEFLIAFLSPSLLNPETKKLVNEKFGADLKKGVTPEQKARTDKILGAMAKDVGNSLRTTYWSVTPYQFGKTYAKYRIVPANCEKDTKTFLIDEALPVDKKDKAYLRTRFQRDLKEKSACFELQVQLHDGKDEKDTATPLDRATFAWDETQFPPKTVATITLQKPTEAGIDSAGELACESMRFTPGHAPLAHAAVGSINEARIFIYDRFSSCRNQQNAGKAGSPAFNAQCMPNKR